MAAGALGLWVSSRMTWVTAAIEDDKAGAATRELTGSVWALESTAVALLVLAGVIAGLALRRGSRIIVGAVVALAGAGAAWRPIQLLTYGADPARAHSLLQAGETVTSGRSATAPETISSWAQVIDASVNTAGPAVALLGTACALLGGVLLAYKPGEDSARSNRYETRAARAEKLADDLDTDPDSGRVMWDALDEDIDPTDLGGNAGGR